MRHHEVHVTRFIIGIPYHTGSRLGIAGSPYDMGLTLRGSAYVSGGGAGGGGAGVGGVSGASTRRDNPSF